MEKEMIYQMGEAIILEVDGVKEVSYPKGESVPRCILIEMEDGQKCKLELHDDCG